MYIYELHLICVCVLLHIANEQPPWNVEKQTEPKRGKYELKNSTAYFTINEDKLCTSDQMQFSVLYFTDF